MLLALFLQGGVLNKTKKKKRQPQQIPKDLSTRLGESENLIDNEDGGIIK